ncbi:MAG: hypothetical protein Q9N62_09545 [Ghiorsea sp.]|nr:hypothetical protein [Ghiorsea sp.]
MENNLCLWSALAARQLWYICFMADLRGSLYHMVNGIRFLLLDIGKTDSREAMKLSAKIVVFSTIAFALLLAIKI